MPLGEQERLAIVLRQAQVVVSVHVPFERRDGTEVCAWCCENHPCRQYARARDTLSGLSAE